MARRHLGTNWNRKQLDDINENFKEVYEGVTDAKENSILKDGSVSSSKLENNSVTDSKIVDGAVNALKIRENAVYEKHIANNQVTRWKIKDGEVVGSKLADKSVTTEKIEDETITSHKLKNKSVTPLKTNFAKIDTTVNLFDGNWTGFYLRDIQNNTSQYKVEEYDNERSILLEIEPNTKYYLQRDSVGFFKIATLKSLPVVGEATDGSVRQLNTNTKIASFTSGINDRYVIITTHTIEESPYVEVTKSQKKEGSSIVFFYENMEYPILIDGLDIEKKVEDRLLSYRDKTDILWYPLNFDVGTQFEFNKNNGVITFPSLIFYANLQPKESEMRAYRVKIKKSSIPFSPIPYQVLVINLEKLFSLDYLNLDLDVNEFMEIETVFNSTNSDQPKKIFSDNYIILGYFDNIKNDFIELNMPPRKKVTDNNEELDKEFYISKLNDSEIHLYTKHKVSWSRQKFILSKSISMNSDVWHLGNVEKGRFESGSFVVDDLIVKKGEWEMAVQIKGRPDFFGGELHGDEKRIETTFKIDGVIVDLSELPSVKTSIKTFEVLERTICYDPSNPTNKVAEHYKQTLIKKNVIDLYQRLKWLESHDLSYSYLSMLPIVRGNDKENARQVTDTAIDNLRMEKFDVSTGGFTNQAKSMVKGISQISVTGKELGISSKVTVERTPELPNSISFVQNTEDAYNKIYFDFCGANYTTSIDEVWEMNTKFELDINK